MYKALTIARYIINYCNERNCCISNLKLQKILYFVQAEFLVSKNKPCFKENVEAWSFGPVVTEVYREYVAYGGAHIPMFKKPSEIFMISKSDQEIIDGMIEECLQYSVPALTNISCNQKPWKDAYYSKMEVIPNEEIKAYFSEEKREVAYV